MAKLSKQIIEINYSLLESRSSSEQATLLGILAAQSRYWWFSCHASKLNHHASFKHHSPFNKMSQEIKTTFQSFGDVQYSELELFGKGYH